LIGGSRDMPGSISLSGMAALRSGAGLVTVAVPAAAHPIVAGFEPSYMTAALADDGDGRLAMAGFQRASELIAHATVVAIGPGLGQSIDVTEFVTTLYREAPLPMVVDADGLNALATKRDKLAEHAGPRVVTPHPGEFARLTGAHGPPADRIAAAIELAKKASIVVVLKGHGTVIADGSRHSINTTGNPGMATGGTGDVLTGVIAALLAQGLAPFEAAQLAVYIHGLAGDLAAGELGQVSLIASDLIRFLPKPFQKTA
jgi:NAD(P)H-hydrate epimerase